MILIKFLKGLWKFPKRRQTDLRKRRQFPVLIILRIKFIGKKLRKSHWAVSDFLQITKSKLLFSHILPVKI